MSNDKFSTPDISHLRQEDFEHVYEPAEDTFLFLDALVQEHDFLEKRKPTCCVEVGCGSGMCITFLAKMLGTSAAMYWCTDINPLAALAAKRTAQQNGVTVIPVLTDLVECLKPRLKHQVDVLLFNPPYVVTPPEEVGSSGIEASWAGGYHGREVMDRLFPQIPDILSPQGIFYLVIIKENKADEIEGIMKGYGYKMWTVLTRRSGPELLSILKFTR
ncbi:hemK methyltransferase family member 2-like [Mizuhopecten yessoensis]|uniref:hemK methyltransferase family member 2-like n=1 Tax=Mizuhopecten yessoensis TaxID=6573 RepID=UPI000B459D01|nr:hemK methyltransferase family member 2-like [Mizuhopecten yessoensis]